MVPSAAPSGASGDKLNVLSLTREVIHNDYTNR